MELTLARLDNGLRILLNLDQSDMVDAGALDAGDEAGWRAFRDDPWRWFIRAGDDRKQAVWNLITQRMR